MLFQYTETGNKGKFFIKTDGNDLAEMTYLLPEPGIMIIDHTEVSDTLKGKNVGYRLVSCGAEYAREKHFKIISLYPFANAVIKKKPVEFSNVLKV